MSKPPQVIPRPAESRRGEPAAWAAVPAALRRGLSLERVRAALTSAVDRTAVRGDAPASAVLVALVEESGETRVVLTRRAATLRWHRHEVSFPGGRVDPGEGLMAAALREAHEEVALDPSSVEVIGTLHALSTVSSPAPITPFVGVLTSRPNLVANPAEVELVLDVALWELMVDGVHTTEWWRRGEEEIELHFFALESDIVWGATGRILNELLCRVMCP